MDRVWDPEQRALGEVCGLLLRPRQGLLWWRAGWSCGIPSRGPPEGVTNHSVVPASGGAKSETGDEPSVRAPERSLSSPTRSPGPHWRPRAPLTTRGGKIGRPKSGEKRLQDARRGDDPFAPAANEVTVFGPAGQAWARRWSSAPFPGYLQQLDGDVRGARHRSTRLAPGVRL